MRYSLILCLLLSVSAMPAADVVGFYNPPQQVDETAGGLDVLVSRVGTGSGIVTVDIQVNVGNATLGVDYNAPSPTTVTWADGDTAMKIVNLPILHNPAFTFGKFMGLSLINPTGGATVSPAYGIVNISIMEQDANPAGIISIVAPNSTQPLTVRDNDGSVDVTLIRHGSTTGAVSATLSLIDQSTTAGVDYTVPGSTTLSWANAEGGTKTLTIPLLARSVAAGPLTFVATISSSTGTNSGPITSLQINILDHLTPVAGSTSFPDAVTVHELAGSAVVSVDRVGGSTGAVTVDYALTDLLAVAGVNYTATSGTLSWANGDAATKTISVPLLADGVAAPLLTALLTFSNPTGGLILPAATTTTLTIVDDDGVHGLIGMSTSSVSVTETAGTATLWVTRSGGSTGAVSIDWTTANGSALAGTNYTAGSGTLNWANGETAAKSITVAILHDSVATADLYAAVGLSNPTGGAGLDNGDVVRTASSLVITNTDAGLTLATIAMQAATVTVSEAAGTATVTLTRTGSSSGPVTAQIQISDDSAQLDADYSQASTHAVQWTDGDATSKSLTIPIINDSAAGPSRNFLVTIGLVSGQAAASTSSYRTTVTITDDDATPAGIVGFVANAVSVDSTDPQVTLSVSRSSGSTGAVSIDWATVFDTPATARAMVDALPENGTLSWANGDTATKTITITLSDDGQPGPDRTLLVQLANPLGGVVLDLGSDHDLATITLMEANTNTAGIIACVNATQTVYRSSSTADITVSRSGGSTGAVSVNYHTVADTAHDGTDYTPIYGTLTWSNGDAAVKTISVALLSVASGTASRTFTLQLDTPAGGATIDQDDTVVTLAEPPGGGSGSGGSSGGGGGGGGCGGSVAGLLLLMGLMGLRHGRRRTDITS